MRQFVRTQRRGGILAVIIAYALAIQGLIASVGLGMAAGAIPGSADFVLCGARSHQGVPVPGDRQAPTPQCPFCFVAAQSAGHVTTTSEPPAFPAYAGSVIATLSRRIGEGSFIPQVRHRLGEARAPPGISV